MLFAAPEQLLVMPACASNAVWEYRKKKKSESLEFLSGEHVGQTGSFSHPAVSSHVHGLRQKDASSAAWFLAHLALRPRLCRVVQRSKRI